jgi:hypothetical protein
MKAKKTKTTTVATATGQMRGVTLGTADVPLGKRSATIRFVLVLEVPPKLTRAELARLHALDPDTIVASIRPVEEDFQTVFLHLDKRDVSGGTAAEKRKALAAARKEPPTDKPRAGFVRHRWIDGKPHRWDKKTRRWRRS